MKNKKGDFTFNIVIKLVLALILLIFLLLFIFSLKDSSTNIFNKIVQALRFGN